MPIKIRICASFLALALPVALAGAAHAQPFGCADVVGKVFDDRGLTRHVIGHSRGVQDDRTLGIGTDVLAVEGF
jgi:hypothetical protein